MEDRILIMVNARVNLALLLKHIKSLRFLNGFFYSSAKWSGLDGGPGRRGLGQGVRSGGVKRKRADSGETICP